MHRTTNLSKMVPVLFVVTISMPCTRLSGKSGRCQLQGARGLLLHKERAGQRSGRVTSSFAQLEFEPFEVTTMNGNKSVAFQYLGCAFPFPDTCV
jgi:hypothetical protein